MAVANATNEKRKAMVEVAQVSDEFFSDNRKRGDGTSKYDEYVKIALDLEVLTKVYEQEDGSELHQHYSVPVAITHEDKFNHANTPDAQSKCKIKSAIGKDANKLLQTKRVFRFAHDSENRLLIKRMVGEFCERCGKQSEVTQ